MVIFGILVMVLFVSVAVINATHEYSGWHFTAVCTAALSGICLVMALLFVPLMRASAEAEMQQFASVRETLEAARGRDGNIENAALQLEVVKANAWLADAQYWSALPALAVYWPEGIAELEPIR